jgi:hypothetical protein
MHMKNHSDTPEAKAVRSVRQQRRRNQRDDPLAKREKLIAFWRKCAITNRGYIPHNGCWWWVFTWNGSFRHLLMPALRARLDERDRAEKKRYQAELQETAIKWTQTKAERAAAKARSKLPQLDLLDAAEQVSG